MRIAYRAKSLADAHNVRDVLADAGITAHIADESSWATAGEPESEEVIRVLVDNRVFDPARRALERWARAREAKQE
ncbi:MAG TPA: DUF2007 domain-containing protein [Polyangiales bacterium]|nr:DUF2007 domain-containing protein [Polyangiales bacterium]